MKKRLGAGIAAILLLIGITVVCARYYRFVSQTIYSESVSHLTEIFHQANRSLYDLVGRNWSDLHLWEDYIRDVSDEQEIDDFIAHAKQENGFTDFYFISREGNYRTVNDETGYLDLRNALSELILHGRDVVVNSVVPGKPQIMVFAAPVAPGTYKGTEYEVIAVSFNNSDIVQALEISAFNGSASSYMIHSDGRIAVDNAARQHQSIYNFLAMLKDHSDMSSQEIARLQEDFKQGRSGATVLRLGDTSYYLIYESAGVQDWTMLGLVPTAVVNASMNNLQSSTLLLVTGIAASLGLLLLALAVRLYRQKLRRKDTEILYRDELFSKVSVNVDDVFLMLDAEALRVDYVSPNIEKLLGISEEQACENIRVLDCLIRNDDAVHVLDQLPEILPGQQGEWDREYIHQEIGELRWFHIIAFCSDIQGEKKYILVMSDRTKERSIRHWRRQSTPHRARTGQRAPSSAICLTISAPP